MIDETSVGMDLPMFKSQFDCVHIDEQWLHLRKESGTFYLATDEEELHRLGKNKHFIDKVKFLAIVAHPQFDRVDEDYSDKVDIFLMTF